MVQSILAVGIGGALGSLLRWWISIMLNSLFPTIPPGTLVVNLIAGYLIGIAIFIFFDYPDLSPEWRLFVITGFLGGLSTFSSFSAEIARLIDQQRYLWALSEICLHVIGSVSMTFFGMTTALYIKNSID